MSTDELVKGIRRIVEQDEKPKGLGDADALKPIGISRGIAYIGSGGSVRGSGAEGGGNDTEPPKVPEPETTPDEGVPDEGGGTGTDSEAGGKTELTGDAAVVNDAATQNSKITSVTGTDPASGTLTTVNFDSKAGIEYVPPDGWDSPDEGPIIDSYVEGKYWTASGYSGATLQALEDTYNANEGSGSDYKIVDDSDCTSGILAPSETGYMVQNVTVSGTFCVAEVGQNDCGGETGTDRCPVTAPRVSEWPADSTCSISYDHDAGGYKGHILDPDCSAQQKTASNFVLIRSQSDPSRYFRYTRLEDGGTKITEVDSGGTPVPSTITKIMDGAGNITGFVDVSLDNFYQ